MEGGKLKETGIIVDVEVVDFVIVMIDGQGLSALTRTGTGNRSDQNTQLPFSAVSPSAEARVTSTCVFGRDLLCFCFMHSVRCDLRLCFPSLSVFCLSIILT